MYNTQISIYGLSTQFIEFVKVLKVNKGIHTRMNNVSRRKEHAREKFHSVTREICTVQVIMLINFGAKINVCVRGY